MDYPLSLSLSRPDRSSRLHLIFGFLIAIPAIIVSLFTGILAGIYMMLGKLVVLFTAKFPRGMWEFSHKNSAFNAQLSAYLSHLTDVAPKWGSVDSHPLKVTMSYPDRIPRWTLFFGIFAIIPHMFLGFFYAIGLMFVAWIAMIVILFAGKYPEGMWNYSFGFLKFSTRINYFMSSLCGQVPPTSMK